MQDNNGPSGVLDLTNDPARRSWVSSANGHPDFPIQNLPFGVFRPSGAPPRGGVAIGDEILDLQVAVELGLFADSLRPAAQAAAQRSLNGFLALGSKARADLRLRVFELLDAQGSERSHLEPLQAHLLRRAQDCSMQVPADIGDYTDFYAGIYHATNVGRLFRPDNPLMPNYKHLPVAYHARASSVGVSGSSIKRPSGQRKSPAEPMPSFAPSARMDYELELGIWIGPGNPLGQPIAIGEAHRHIAGFCLLNDWSARDIQAWEYQPLGPFLAKDFATTISPWIITPEALAPFRIPQPPRSEHDPRPLDYLWDPADQDRGALDIALEVLLSSAAMRRQGLPALRLCLSNARYLYWTVAQMLTHHSSNGCNLRPGDLFGSGTISGPTQDSCGSLLEITEGGRRPVRLPSGEERRFLEDGDEIILRARTTTREDRVQIGFGECRAELEPARKR